MKAKRSLLNFATSISSQVILMVFSFIIPRIILVNLGSETNGLLSSLGQFFVYFDLFSAGIGSATILSLYKFIAVDDKKSIVEVLSASRVYYRKAGGYYLLCVLALLIIYPLVVSTEISNLKIVLVIFLNGIAGYISFVFMRSIICLLNAEGKDYIVTIIGFIVHLLSSIGKIVILVVFKDIVILQMYYLFIILLQSLIYYLYIKNKYSWVVFLKNPDMSHLSQRNSLVIHQITTLVFLSSGSIILSLFADLKTVSVYAIFMLINNLLRSVLTSFYSSTSFLFGHIYQDNIEKYIKFSDFYNILNITLVSILFSVAYFLYMPFVKLYTAGISDVNYIDYNLPIYFCLISIFYLSRIANNNAIMVAGHAGKTAKRSLLEMFINISLSVVLVQFIGIYGVLIGSLVSLFYRANDIIIYTNIRIFKRKPWKEYKLWLTNLFLFATVVYFSNFIQMNIVSYLDFIRWGIIISLVFFSLFFIISILGNYKEYKYFYLFGYNWVKVKYRKNKL